MKKPLQNDPPMMSLTTLLGAMVPNQLASPEGAMSSGLESVERN